jgi:hypothetical protein
MDNLDTDAELSAALVIYLGYDWANCPGRNEGQVRANWNSAKAEEFLFRISILLKELGRIEVDWSMHTLVSAGEYAKRIMRLKHPYLTEKALDSLEWKFTFDWR